MHFNNKLKLKLLDLTRFNGTINDRRHNNLFFSLQMNFYVLATCFVALVASGHSASVYPAGVDPNACPE